MVPESPFRKVLLGIKKAASAESCIKALLAALLAQLQSHSRPLSQFRAHRAMALQLFADNNGLLSFPFEQRLCRRDDGQPEANKAVRNTHLDVIEKPKVFEVAADLPGLAKEDIKLQVDGKVLKLSAERSQSKQSEPAEETGVKVHRVERSARFTGRSVRLPKTADLSNITARYQDGVLYVSVPKLEVEAEQSRVITIE